MWSYFLFHLDYGWSAMSPSTAALLGFGTGKAISPIALADRVTEGLPVATLARVSGTVAPGDAGFKFRIVGKTTLSRRLKSQKLSSGESEKLARVANVWSMALEVWKSEEAARDFLFRPNWLLESRPPMDVALQSEFGAQEVIRILGELEYGVAL